MPKRGEISEIVDGMLKVLVFGGVVSVGIVAPNAVQALDKPLKKYFKKMDARARRRELAKTMIYMRKQGLIKGDYEHGLQVTEKGRLRAEKADLDDLKITKPDKWDGKWRLIFFDIPEQKKTARDALTRKIKELGFRQLQKSVWILPYGCREEIEMICAQYEIDKFVTYIETAYIDKQKSLQKLFNI